MANPFDNRPTVFLTQAQYETLVAGGKVTVTDFNGNTLELGPGLNNLGGHDLLYVCWRDDIKGPTGPVGPRGAIGEGYGMLHANPWPAPLANILSRQNVDTYWNVISFEGKPGDIYLAPCRITDRENTIGYMSLKVSYYDSNLKRVYGHDYTFMYGPIGPQGPEGAISSVTNSGAGNAVTDVSLDTSSKTLTVTKGNYVPNSTYESAINNLNNAVANRYTKAETDGRYVPNSTYESAINNLNTAVANRYTKAETDGRYVPNSTYESAINNLNTAVANRYTKAETDGKLDDEAVKTKNSAEYTYEQIRALKRSYIGSVDGGIYNPQSSHENIIRIINNNFGGENYALEMSHDFWENTGLHYRYKAEGNFSDWYTLVDSGNVGDYVGQYTAKSFTYADSSRVNLDSETAVAKAGSWMKAIFNKDTNFDGHTYLKVVRAEYNSHRSDAGMFGFYDCGLAWSNADTGGLMTVAWDNVQAKISSYCGSGLAWTRYLVLSPDGSDISSQHVAYANSAQTATYADKSAVCESTTLLKAEGENIGAKIQSQYTSGSIGGGVTYHQATWYVVGNDGDTYNFGKMITTDNFGTNLTEALKKTKIEYSTRSDYATFLDYMNSYSTSISIAYDDDRGTSLKYTSYPRLTINSATGYGVLEGNVYNHGTFQLAVSGNSNGMIYVRSVAKGGSAPSWVKLLNDGDVVNSLSSSSTNRPLSAYQGNVLSGKITSIDLKFLGYQPKLNSETGAIMQWLSFKNGSSYSISGIWCGSVSLTLKGSVGSNASSNFTISSSYQSSFGRGGWYVCASPISGGYVDTMAYGVEYTNNTAYGGKIWARRVYSGADVTYTFNIIAIRLY